MSVEEKKELTKDWIGLMLYTGPKTSDELINIGCKVMVYGWEYEEFNSILNEMVDDESIIQYNSGKYALETKGRFNVKKKSIVPLLQLLDNPEYTSSFIEKNRENCDYQFLEMLYSERIEDKRESMIVKYGERGYHLLGPTISLVKEFLQNPPSL